MTVSVKGTINKVDIGPGAWAIKSEDGKTYQIFMRNFPKELLVEGSKILINGKIRDDIMTTAMIGPVLEMESYETI